MINRNKKNPEIHLHKDLMKYFDVHQIDYLAYGSNGPDFILKDLNVLGEVKRDETMYQVKEAIKEAFNRKGKYSINNYSTLFIVTPKYIRVFDVRSITEYLQLDLNSAIMFDLEDLNLFVDFLKNNQSKIDISNHLDYALNLLMSEKLDISIQETLNIILHLNDPCIFVKNGVYFNPGEPSEFFIEIKAKESEILIRNFIKKFKIDNLHCVKNYIKHNYSSHLPDSKKSNLGKYYTPKNIVSLMKKMIEPQITTQTFVLDMACGCGAFLELFEDCKIIGRDIDAQAIEVLELLNFHNIKVDNSLENVNREKYGLKNEDNLIIVGNPPYNDTTSKNKRFGTNQKTKVEMKIDEDIKTKDLGISFLRAFSKLNPTYICVLHPLSYLIKERNFKQLSNFKDSYKLTKGIIFSSKLFKDLKKGTEFPVVIAFYEKGSMSYKDIEDFTFDILNSDEKFILNSFETIDGFIRKYPTKNPLNSKEIMLSDIDLYMYNIRDTNSLISSGNLMCGKSTDKNYVTIQFEELYKYAYLNCYKHFFPNSYIYGNLSPLVNKEELSSNEYLQDLFVMGLILKNQRLDALNLTNKESLVYKKFLINDYKRKSKNSKEKDNIYQIFLDYVKTGDEDLPVLIFREIKEYFELLIK